MMDQKKKVVARLSERFAGSSLPGVVDAGATRPESEPGAAPQKQVSAGRPSVKSRYAHLDLVTRGMIDSLLAIESSLPIRGFLTEDGRRAGIVIGEAVRVYHWEDFRRYSRLFFGPAHEAICTVFRKELNAVARHYGKNPVDAPKVVLYAEQQAAGGRQ